MLKKPISLGQIFKPEDVRAMTTAFEQAIYALDLEARPELTLDLIARTIIRFANQGESDPATLCERTVATLSNAASKMVQVSK